MKLGVTRGVLVAAAIAAVPAVARADERDMFVTVAGSIGIGGPSEDDRGLGDGADPEGVLAARISASWELDPLPYKEPKGYRFRGALVPEVTLGRLRVADHRTGDPEDNSANFVALGARAEVGFSQRRGGLLAVSGRGGFYLAARVGLLGDEHRTPLGELVVGEYLYLGDSARIGFDVGVMGLFGTQTDEEEWQIRPTVSARGPWLDNTGNYFAFVGSLYLGFKL